MTFDCVEVEQKCSPSSNSSKNNYIPTVVHELDGKCINQGFPNVQKIHTAPMQLIAISRHIHAISNVVIYVCMLCYLKHYLLAEFTNDSILRGAMKIWFVITLAVLGLLYIKIQCTRPGKLPEGIAYELFSFSVTLSHSVPKH